MIGRDFKIVRMWAQLSQERLLEAMGKSPKSRSILYYLEKEREDSMPLEYIKKLSEFTGYNLDDNEVVRELVDNKIPRKYKQASRLRRGGRIYW